jgi:hypothetical protein
MIRRGWLAAIGAMALAWNGPSSAQQYRPDEFLNLDLSRAVLSPTPLGPATSFVPGPLDVTVDRGNNAAEAKPEFAVEPKAVPTATVHAESRPETRPNSQPDSKPVAKTALRTAAPRARVAQARAERPAPRKPRALVALHQRSPMEAQARDTSIQVWPCRSGGICNWKR